MMYFWAVLLIAIVASAAGFAVGWTYGREHAASEYADTLERITEPEAQRTPGQPTNTGEPARIKRARWGK